MVRRQRDYDRLGRRLTDSLGSARSNPSMNPKFLAIAVATAVLTSGCMTTATKSRDRNGDFVSNMAVAAPASGTIRG
jgi:hypothetical protein